MKKFLLCVVCMVIVLTTRITEAKKPVVDHSDMGKIIVIGAINPDCDAVSSAIVAADLLKQMGYDADPMVAGTVNMETEYVLKRFGVARPERLENATGKNLFLVAHGEYGNAVKGADKAALRGIIDNYNLSGINVVEPIIIVARPYGSTCTLINQIYDFEKRKLSKQMAGMMLAGIISETVNLKANITTNLDRVTVKKLAKRAGVGNVDKFAQEMFAEGWSWKGWSDKNILKNDMKKYHSKYGDYYISQIQCNNAAAVENMKSRMKFFVPKYMEAKKIDALFVQLLDMEKVTMEILPFGEGVEDVAKKAFRSSEPGKYVMAPGKISWRQDVLPALRSALDK